MAVQCLAICLLLIAAPWPAAVIAAAVALGRILWRTRRRKSMPTGSNYLCGCGRFMRPKTVGVTVEELLEDGSPYKLWKADLFECDECGVEIIAGFGMSPLAEHWQGNYAEQRARRLPVYPGRCAPER